jgi:hypothetical protein
VEEEEGEVVKSLVKKAVFVVTVMANYLGEIAVTWLDS